MTKVKLNAQACINHELYYKLISYSEMERETEIFTEMLIQELFFYFYVLPMHAIRLPFRLSNPVTNC